MSQHGVVMQSYSSEIFFELPAKGAALLCVPVSRGTPAGNDNTIGQTKCQLWHLEHLIFIKRNVIESLVWLVGLDVWVSLNC